MQTPHPQKNPKKTTHRERDTHTHTEESVQQVMHRQNHRNQINHTPITHNRKTNKKFFKCQRDCRVRSIIFCSGTLHTMFWMKITLHKTTCFGWRALRTKQHVLDERSLCTKQHVLDEDHTAQNNMFWMFWMKITLHKPTCFGWRSLCTKQHVLDNHHYAQNNMFWMFWMKIIMHKPTCFGWRSLCTKQHVLDNHHSARNMTFWMKISTKLTMCV